MSTRSASERSPKNPGPEAAAVENFGRTSADSLRVRFPAFLFGLFLGLSLLKFGNPVIMEKWTQRPTSLYEWVLMYPWPITCAYWLMGVVVLAALPVIRWRAGSPRWIPFLVLLWLLWQALATSQSVDVPLAKPTLTYFIACVVCYFLGFAALSQLHCLRPFWFGLCGGLMPVLAFGLDQHFGGLAETRRFFYDQLQLYPDRALPPPELVKRMTSTRIFSTLFYPNALAGALLLLFPIVLYKAARFSVLLKTARKKLRLSALGLIVLLAFEQYWAGSKVGWLWTMALAFLTLLPVGSWPIPAWIAVAGLGCLFWSGSKGGWLLMLLLGLVTLLRLPMGKRLRICLVVTVLAAGLVGFFWKYSSFFQKGATSVSARFDYWQAAAKTAISKPAFGTGPGTFAIPYAQLKRPESEMTRLVHNDYLEQASDSGLIGFLAYGGLILGALAWSFPSQQARWDRFLVWLGLLGWCLQGLFEFGLYIPALTWPSFALLGWLSATARPPNEVPPAHPPDCGSTRFAHGKTVRQQPSA